MPHPALVISAPAEMTVALHREFFGEETVEPSFIEEKDGLRRYGYAALPAGHYHVLAAGEGLYTVQKLLSLAGEGCVEVQIPAEKKKGQGYEPDKTPVRTFTDGMLQKVLPSDPALWPEYQALFTTPAFSAEKAAHEFTSQEEMLAFLDALAGSSPHAYRYSLGKSGAYGYEIPLLIFTKSDLSGAKTLEEAALILQKSQKPLVHYQAQIHGNEPAAGETALSVIRALHGPYGEKLLSKLDLYVIPRANPDGARA